MLGTYFHFVFARLKREKLGGYGKNITTRRKVLSKTRYKNRLTDFKLVLLRKNKKKPQNSWQNTNTTKHFLQHNTNQNYVLFGLSPGQTSISVLFNSHVHGQTTMRFHESWQEPLNKRVKLSLTLFEILNMFQNDESAREPMRVHESQWECMRVSESARELMRVHGSHESAWESWELVRVNESARESMRVHENQWEPMRVHGSHESQWECMRVNESAWESVRVHESQWERMGVMRVNESARESMRVHESQ